LLLLLLNEGPKPLINVGLSLCRYCAVFGPVCTLYNQNSHTTRVNELLQSVNDLWVQPIQ